MKTLLEIMLLLGFAAFMGVCGYLWNAVWHSDKMRKWTDWFYRPTARSLREADRRWDNA